MRLSVLTKEADQVESSNHATTRLIVKSRSAYVFLTPSEIVRIEALDRVTQIHTRTEAFETRTSIGSLEQILPADTFVRISRSHIINLDYVRMVEHWFRGQYRFFLNDGHFILGSRRYRDRIRRVLDPASQDID